MKVRFRKILKKLSGNAVKFEKILGLPSKFKRGEKKHCNWKVGRKEWLKTKKLSRKYIKFENVWETIKIKKIVKKLLEC